MSGGGRTVTGLLRAWGTGDQAALDELMPLVYGELHKLAAGYMRGERVGHTMRPTALISEAYLRLAEGTSPDLSDRVQFYGIAARVMRQVLVDHARKHNAEKRGAGELPITFDDGLAIERPEAMIALDAALDRLAALDGRKARAIELHYFAGLSHEEVAEALGVHANTINRDLRLAVAWLHQQLRGDS